MLHTGADISDEEAQKLLQACKTTPNYKPTQDIAGDLYREYQSICKMNNVVDFYDIMSMSLNMLQDGSLPVLKATHMFVDEFQDCDEIQYQYLMRHAMTGTVQVMAVGDDDQAIYAFRNSLGFKGMQRFEKDVRAKRIILDTNYRCRKEILDAADKLIQFNNERMEKNLIAFRGKGGEITVTNYESRNKEAEGVLEKITQTFFNVSHLEYFNNRQKYQEVIEHGKFAVLARNNIILENIDSLLKAYQIPVIKSFSSIWEKTPVSLYLSLMDALSTHNKTNIDHLLHWLGVHHDDLIILNKLLDNNYGNLFNPKFTAKLDTSSLSDKASKFINGFIKDANGWAKGSSRDDNQRTENVIIQISEWMQGKSKKKLEKERLQKAEAILKLVKGTIRERIAFVTRDNSADEEGRGISLLTMHASKGLEFDNVWIIGAETDVIPSNANIIMTETFTQEERRLMYVAMTRAKDNLFISAAMGAFSIFVKEAKLK